MIKQFTAIIEREDGGYVALCPELDIASQGGTIEEARANLREALELFMETAPREEIDRRLRVQVGSSGAMTQHGQLVPRVLGVRCA